MVDAGRKILNRLRVNTSYLQQKHRSSGLPLELTIELTNNCNLECIMCPRSMMQRATGYMDPQLFKKIIDEATDFVEMIDLDLYGESTFHPRLGELIRYARDAGIKTLLSTNMTMMSEEKMQEIIDSGLDMLYISIDGAQRETYESIRVQGKYEQVVENTKRFLALKGRRRPYTVLQMIHMHPTRKEGEAFRTLWEGKADAVRIKPYLTLDPRTGVLGTEKKRERIKPCIMPWRRLVVTWDGTVVPCCNDYDNIHPVGNAREETLHDIWNGDRLRALRELHAQGKKDSNRLCRNCNPFEASTSMVLASTLTDGMTIRKLIPRFENSVVKGKSRLFKYS